MFLASSHPHFMPPFLSWYRHDQIAYHHYFHGPIPSQFRLLPTHPLAFRVLPVPSQYCTASRLAHRAKFGWTVANHSGGLSRRVNFFVLGYSEIHFYSAQSVICDAAWITPLSRQVGNYFFSLSATVMKRRLKRRGNF